MVIMNHSYQELTRAIAIAMCVAWLAAPIASARTSDVPTPAKSSSIALDIVSRDVSSDIVSLRFNLVRAGIIRLVLIDRDGKEVGVLASGLSSAGVNVIEIDTRKIPAGEYRCILQTRDGNASTPLVISR